MSPEDLQSLVASHGYECWVRRGEVQVRTCWRCGNDRWNLELNVAIGAWHCWACGDGGRLDSLLSSTFGRTIRIPTTRRPQTPRESAPLPSQDFHAVPIRDVLSAQLYLDQRGLSLPVAEEYELAVCLEPEHLLYKRILLPLRDFWTQELRGYSGRAYIPGQRPKYLSNSPTRFISGYRRRGKSVPVVVVEGSFDGITCHRAGFQGAVLGGTGDATLEEWAARLPVETPLVILLDGSAIQQARSLVWTITPIRPVSLATLPSGLDPGSLAPETIRKVVEQCLT